MRVAPLQSGALIAGQSCSRLPARYRSSTEIPNPCNPREIGGRATEYRSIPGVPFYPNARRADSTGKSGRKSIPDCPMPPRSHNRTAPIRRPHCRTVLFPTTCAVPIEHRNTKTTQFQRNRGRATECQSIPGVPSSPNARRADSTGKSGRKSIPDCPPPVHTIAIHPHLRPCALKYQIHEIPEIAGTSATGAPPVPAFPSAPHTHNVSAQNAAFPRKSLQNAAISCKIAQPTNPHDSEPFCAQMSQNFRFSRDYVASRQPLQTSTHPNEPEYFSNSGILSSIALLPLPHAGKTLSNRFNDLSR